MAYMTIEVPGGVIGDIEAALIRSGFKRLDSAEFAEHIIPSGGSVSFKTNKLGKSEIDPALLAQELRATGLIVRWTGEAAA
jgi:hypothetical protein